MGFSRDALFIQDCRNFPIPCLGRVRRPASARRAFHSASISSRVRCKKPDGLKPSLSATVCALHCSIQGIHLGILGAFPVTKQVCVQVIAPYCHRLFRIRENPARRVIFFFHFVGFASAGFIDFSKLVGISVSISTVPIYT